MKNRKKISVGLIAASLIAACSVQGTATASSPESFKDSAIGMITNGPDVNCLSWFMANIMTVDRELFNERIDNFTEILHKENAWKIRGRVAENLDSIVWELLYIVPLGSQSVKVPLGSPQWVRLPGSPQSVLGILLGAEEFSRLSSGNMYEQNDVLWNASGTPNPDIEQLIKQRICHNDISSENKVAIRRFLRRVSIFLGKVISVLSVRKNGESKNDPSELLDVFLSSLRRVRVGIGHFMQFLQ